MNTVELDKRFSFARLALLIRNRAIDDAAAFAIVGAGVFALKLLGLFIGAHVHRDAGRIHEIWPVLIVAGGILLAFRAFERMHDGRGGSDWVLLPASPLEKYLAAFLSYLVLYPVVATAAAVLLSGVLALIGALIGAEGAGVWIPAAMLNPGQATSYFLFAALGLAGSARFRKLPLVKTAAVSIGWMAFLGMVWFGLVFLFARENLSIAFSGGDFSMKDIELTDGKLAVMELLSRGMKAAAFVAAVLFGYFRVREKESVDEVQ